MLGLFVLLLYIIAAVCSARIEAVLQVLVLR